MMSFLRKYWWILLLLLVAPVVFNYIIACPSTESVIADDSAWLSFFGSFFGSAIMVGVTLYVLEKQSSDNQKENTSIKEQNTDLFKYQVKEQWLDKLRQVSGELYTSFNLNDLSTIEDDVLKNNDTEHIREKLKRLKDKINMTIFNWSILFPKELDDTEKKYINNVRNLSNEYIALLEDLEWYLKKIACHNGGNDMLNKIYTEETKKYKEEKESKCKTHSKRIWDIIESNDYKIYGEQVKIVKERMKCTEYFSFAIIQKAISDLIGYEEDKINRIIIR